MSGQLMTIPEFAERIRVKPRTAYDIVASGAIDVVDVGTGKRPSFRISEEALAEYLKARKVKGRAA